MIKKGLLIITTLLIPLTTFAGSNRVADDIRQLSSNISTIVSSQTNYQCQAVLMTAADYAAKSADRLEAKNKMVAKGFLGISASQLDLAAYQHCEEYNAILHYKNRATELQYRI